MRSSTPYLISIYKFKYFRSIDPREYAKHYLHRGQNNILGFGFHWA